jgi:hypothetical protein
VIGYTAHRLPPPHYSTSFPPIPHLPSHTPCQCLLLHPPHTSSLITPHTESGLCFSPPVRPSLSPASFCKEMSRLKKENYSIRDDISRFRSTLQVPYSTLYRNIALGILFSVESLTHFSCILSKSFVLYLQLSV